MDNKNFNTYEYSKKIVKSSVKEYSMDILIALGYEITDVEKYGYTNDSIIISVKRGRKIKHKDELNRLEKKIDNELKQVNKLQEEETRSALIIALSIGISGTLILGGGMSMTLTQPNNVLMFVFGIIIGIIGIGICLINDFIYKKNVSKKRIIIEPKIDAIYEKIANICEQATCLINQTDL